ncbi:MAG: secondary thiamine-phosphate synthase enzyme YjbQ [Flavobacteriales bacterium]|nr:secondary thiamine-phosphate synthase enzyme YjbQ [Flavobacteriales bacterium]
MIVKQIEIDLPPYPRGFHIITDTVISSIKFPKTGICNVFLNHTSAGITINENADPDVRHDFELFMNKIAPEDLERIRHTYEGPDDMPAHIKSSIIGQSLSIPITDHRLKLGTWQGIYLCEFRNQARGRKLSITVIGN